MHLPIDHADDAGLPRRSGAAGRALECTTEPRQGGGADYDSGLASAQDTAQASLQNFLERDFPGVIPRDGYLVEREDDGHVLFSYDVDGRTRVALVAADHVRDWNKRVGWGIEAWAACDPSELPEAVSTELGFGVWRDADGSPVPTTVVQSYTGPEHCGWQTVVFLRLDQDGEERLFLRDPSGTLAERSRSAFSHDVALPPDAVDTGFSRTDGHLWLDPDGTAAYLVDDARPGRAERWPAAKSRILCA